MIEKVYRRPYREKRYMTLINSLRQPNRYAYAALYKTRPARTGRHARVIKLPEGWLLLARTTHAHAPELQDLRARPVALRYFILTFDHTRNRIRLQISKRFWRQKLAYVSEVCNSREWHRTPKAASSSESAERKSSTKRHKSRHRKYRHETPGRSEARAENLKHIAQVLTSVNAATREMLEIDRHAFVHPGTRRAWDKRVRRHVVTWLTFHASMRLDPASKLVNSRIITWYRLRTPRAAASDSLQQQLQSKKYKAVLLEQAVNSLAQSRSQQ